jgi:hypothetical protein
MSHTHHVCRLEPCIVEQLVASGRQVGEGVGEAEGSGAVAARQR